MSSKWWLPLGASCVFALGIAACGDDDGGVANLKTVTGAEKLKGTIKIDGSSTLFPFAQAGAELFRKQAPDVRITVGQSGTGGGFEKFCAGETAISDASRAIEAEERDICKEEGIGYDEVQVANDGIAVVTNPALDVKCLTTKQLKELWNRGSKVKSLKEIDPKLPGTELKLYGPGTDSGTFDFFTEEINGEEGASREDYSPSERDDVLVKGVEGNEGGLGYFGFSYAEQAAEKLNVVEIDAGDGCVAPSQETIQSGEYKPLSRPLFMYPSSKELAKPEVKGYMDFVLDNQELIAEEANIVPMTEEQTTKAKDGLAKAEGN